MTSNNLWNPSPRLFVILLCSLAMLAIGARVGWSVNHQLTDVVTGIMFAGFSCVVLVLGMLFVRSVFEASSLRIMFDVLALFIWAFMVLSNGGAFFRASTMSKEERSIILLTPMVTIVFTLGAVMVVSAVGLINRLRSRHLK